MPEDRFTAFKPGLNSPLTMLENVTPSDTVDLASVTRALNVASDGTVRVTGLEGGIVTLTVAAGIPFPVRVTRVWATGTSATGIVGMS